MGANPDYRIYLTDDKQLIKQQWDDAVNQSQYENGISYSGCIGMLDGTINFISKIFNSQDEAEWYISDHHAKWDRNPIAVPFRIPNDNIPTYLKNAIKKTLDAGIKKDNVENELTNNLLHAKSKFVTCKSCKSKLNRKNLSNSYCPLCNTTLLSNASIKRIESLKDKARKARLHWSDMRDKATKANCTGKIGYVVGGICPS